MNWTPGPYLKSAIITLALSIALVGFLCFAWSLLCFRTKKEQVHPGYKSLYLGLFSRPNLYPAAFLARRVAFAAVAVFMQGYPVGQVFCVMVTSVFMLGILWIEHPYIHHDYNQLQLFNEACILFACAHLVCFSPFVGQLPTRRSLGFTLILLTIIIVIVNLLLAVHALWKAALLITVHSKLMQ